MGARQVLQRAKLAGEMYAASAARGKPICVVYGNCQAEAIRQTLMLSPDFRSRYRAVRVPPVHTVTRAQLAALRSLLKRTSIFVTQPIHDDLRSLPVGTDQMAKYLPKSARTVTYPSMYFGGFHPYQVTVHLPGQDLSIAAPVTDYHDLRFMFAAANKWDASTAFEWFETFESDPEYVRSIYDSAMASLADREASLDTEVTSEIRARGSESFFTLNHPSNPILATVARQIFDLLGVDSTSQSARHHFLDSLQAPVESSILDALGMDSTQSSEEWTVLGKRVTQSRALEAHLEWYAQNPDALAAGLRKHSSRMRLAGLVPIQGLQPSSP